MAKQINVTDLALSHRAARFEGQDFGASVSFFITTHRDGEGPDLHRHPYEEIFLVQEGEAVFTIDGETVRAHAGQILVVPAYTPHQFRGVGDEPLRQVSIHAAPAMETEWLT